MLFFNYRKLPLQEPYIYIVRWHSSALKYPTKFSTHSELDRMEGAHDKRRSPAANYEYKVEQRAVKHREISHRNNTTSCRSPTRDLDTRWIKTEMHRKRQFEFFKRRPVDHGTYTLLSAVPRHRYSRETLHAPEHMTQTLTSIRQPLITSRNVKLQRDAINFTKQVERLLTRSLSCYWWITNFIFLMFFIQFKKMFYIL